MRVAEESRMLDNEPDASQTTDGTEPAPTPRRRRAASRPAGPPATTVPPPPEPAPAVENVDAAPAAAPPAATQDVVAAPEVAQQEVAAPVEASQQEVAAPVEASQQEVAAPVEASQSEVAAADLTGAGTGPVAKTATKRAPRKASAKRAAEDPAANAEPVEAAPQNGAPRKRTPRKAAEPPVLAPEPVETPTDETPTDQTRTAEASTDAAVSAPGDVSPAGWVAPGSEPSVQGETDPDADATSAAERGDEASLGTTLTLDVELASSDAPSRTQTDDPVLAASLRDSSDRTLAVNDDESDTDEPTADSDADDSSQAVTPDYSWLADPFAAPAAAADNAVVDQDDSPEEVSDDSSTDDTGDVDATDADADAADDDEPGDGSRRRRRRRGGRRRRRGAGDDSTDESDAEPDNDIEQATQPIATDVSGPAQGAGGEEADDAEGEDSEGQRRRRRRRRRRGEDTATLPDDPAEVVVRVREPRTRKRATSSSEVTGIEGSTRMEAKRQRRREGRDAGRRRVPILSEAEFLARRESVLRQMIIRQGPELAQIAVLEDGILVEHYVDRDSAASLIGNVYLGRVQNVLPSMEAAFVDIGRGRNAVLYAGEVDWDSFGADGHNRKVEKVLKSGQMILVQVTKDPVGAKGARLTNHVSIPGRYVVYAPGGHLSGISRKLPDIERRRLKDILADLVGESASVIVRTAAEGASEDELVRDVNRLKAQWADIERKVKAGNSPQLLYGEPDLTVRIVRDLFTEDFSELVIQGNASMTDAYDAVVGYVSHVAPHLQERIRRWEPTGEDDLFAEYRLDEQIAKALERKVFLPSGGSLVIDRTEAMTVIDVNTGKFTGTGGNLEATVTSNNLEAAEEIVRQLRLRDVGGIIVIDFIDMVLPSNRDLLLRRLVECLGRDRTRHQVAEVTSLGLVQMTRKKIGTGLLEAFGTECPHCHGRGYELNDQPVDSQQQADGGTREQRGRDRSRGNDHGGRNDSGSKKDSGSKNDSGQRNGSSRNASPVTEDAQAAGADSGGAVGGNSDQGERSGQSGRSRGGRRGRSASADREPAGEATEPGASEPNPEPQVETTAEPVTSG